MMKTVRRTCIGFLVAALFLFGSAPVDAAGDHPGITLHTDILAPSPGMTAPSVVARSPMAARSVNANLRSPKVWDVDFGFEASHIHYEEKNLMQEQGFMYGPTLDITRHFGNGYVVSSSNKFSFGNVDYSSNAVGNPVAFWNDIPDYMYEGRWTGGADRRLGPKTAITPYVGFGYRRLFDNLYVATAGYDRVANYYYSPIGIDFIYEPNTQSRIKMTAEYDYLLRGVQESKFSQVNSAYSDMVDDQHNGYGYRGSIDYSTDCRWFAVDLGIFVKYWKIENSDIDLSAINVDGKVYQEPKNTSTEVGIRLGLGF